MNKWPNNKAYLIALKVESIIGSYDQMENMKIVVISPQLYVDLITQHGMKEYSCGFAFATLYH